ncbi:hypothetical protein ES705_21129 [subsurface metagenome]
MSAGLDCVWLLQKIRLFFTVYFRLLDYAAVFLLEQVVELRLQRAYRRYIHTLGHDVTVKEFLLSRGGDTSNSHLDNNSQGES